MGYPIYKLLRAVNRQYPNNGFINYVDVREDMYNDMIDEDLRDLINETIQEVYIDVAIDEVYSFPTVPGQNQYVLPEDCDLRDIQEVTRTYGGIRGPLKPPCGPGPIPVPGFTAVATFDANRGTGEMEPIEVAFGEKITLPECTFIGPNNKPFLYWSNSAHEKCYPGDEVEMYEDETYSAIWDDDDPEPVWDIVLTLRNATDDDKYITVEYKYLNSSPATANLYYNQTRNFDIGANGTLGEVYEYIRVAYEGDVFLTLDMSEVYTDNTVRNVEHPSDLDPEPDWEDPDDNSQIPATPSVTPDDDPGTEWEG